jgi:hypothetical protein
VTESNAVHALLSVVNLAVVWFLVSNAWPAYRVETFRQDLFDIRDMLFDVAISDRRLFAHPSYVLLRNRINSSIRFAHKFTTTRLIITLILLKRHKIITGTEDWMLTLHELPEESQNRLREVHKAMVKRIAVHLFHIPFGLFAFLVKVMSAVAKKEIVEKVEMMEAQAVEEVNRDRELAVAAR